MLNKIIITSLILSTSYSFANIINNEIYKSEVIQTENQTLSNYTISKYIKTELGREKIHNYYYELKNFEYLDIVEWSKVLKESLTDKNYDKYARFYFEKAQEQNIEKLEIFLSRGVYLKTNERFISFYTSVMKKYIKNDLIKFISMMSFFDNLTSITPNVNDVKEDRIKFLLLIKEEKDLWLDYTIFDFFKNEENLKKIDKIFNYDTEEESIRLKRMFIKNLYTNMLIIEKNLFLIETEEKYLDKIIEVIQNSATEELIFSGYLAKKKYVEEVIENKEYEDILNLYKNVIKDEADRLEELKKDFLLNHKLRLNLKN